MADEDENNNEKVKKFGPRSVASEITEELRKQKSNRKGWILFCKRFQTCSFMCEKKLFRPNPHISLQLITDTMIEGKSNKWIKKLAIWSPNL